MKGFLLLCTLFIGLLNTSNAQDLSQYNRAKTLIDYGNYSDAMGLLRPYMDQTQFGRLSLYASYHYARAAYGNRQFLLAESVLKDLVTQENWENKDKAKYLLALTHFQSGRNLDALDLINQIRDAAIKQEAENATYAFLKEASMGFFAGNIKKYSDNKGFMLALKQTMERQSIMSSEERAIYNELASMDFGTTSDNKTAVKNTNSLDIAVLLPFNYSGGRGVQNLNHNNFIFELYQGIHFAFEQLKKQGRPISIKTFDTERNASKIQNILTDPFLKQADLIIGPVYPEESELVTAFAERNKIPFINPLSNIEDRLMDTDYSYLFRPSISAMADGILDFSRRNFVGKRIAIGYSNTGRDEQLSRIIATNAQKLGYTVVRNEPINGRSVMELMEKIQLKNGDAALADIVIILSDDPNVASPTFGFMESQNVRKPVLVMESWLYFNFANFEMLEEQNFHFISNNSVNFQSESLEEFREEFYKTYIGYPSFNSHLGFELMHWVANNINPNLGFDLRQNLNKKGFQNGTITFGFDFRNSNFNKHVPILKLESGLLIAQ